MPTKQITGQSYRVLLSGGLKRLAENCVRINKLNVFPVPDGDTGDNMQMTLQSGLEQTAADEELPAVCDELSKGMLYGARGNSGVILSRFFYGMNRFVSERGDVITADDLASGFERGVAEAYAAVSSPKEGTILTVMRETTDAAKASTPADFETFFDAAVPAAAQSLKKTPELLAVLKNAGVVDSGGAGFLCILEGMKDALESGDSYTVRSGGTKIHELSADDELLGYCTEFILQLKEKESFSLEDFKAFLNAEGSSVVAFANGNLVKVHVHTFSPERVLAAAHRAGEFLTIKIENMSVMHSESTVANEFEIPERKNKYGLVAVACGEGVKQLLADGGCMVVDGGRSMNPSAQDILNGIRQAGAETVFVFPNHKNVFLAANQAKEMCSFCRVILIDSEDLGHCYQALSLFDDALTPEELTERFCSARGLGRTVHVARAIRPCTTEDGAAVNEGDWLCFDRERILVADRSEDEAVYRLFEGTKEAPPDVVILLFGEEKTQQEAEVLAGRLADRFPDTEWITVNGGQPIYDYTFMIR